MTTQKSTGKGISRRSKIIIASIVILIVAISSAVALIQLTSFHPASLPVQQVIVYEPVIINASTYAGYQFIIPEGARSPEIYGNFALSNDSTGTIRVYVMDSGNYADWQNNRTSSFYYNSGQVNSAAIEQTLDAGKTYYLIFDNTLSTTPKNITTNIQYQYFPSQ